jgi:hypothetical protein
MSGKVALDRWLPHLVAARREGQTLMQYARGRGLSRHTLYAACQSLRRMQGEAQVRSRALALRGRKPLAPSPFAAVRLAVPAAPAVALHESRPRLRAQLPNGVELELAWEGAQPGLLVAAIGALARR